MKAVAAGLALVLTLGQGTAAFAAEDKIAVVAAENFYGDIARQIAGDRITVASIMTNPDQDPHLFETTPATVRQIAGAQIVILNGASYDPWMEKLLDATPRSPRTVINVAQLTRRKPGDNPHFWYDPATMPVVATAIAEALGKVDGTHASDYAARLKVTLASLAVITQRVAQLKTKHAGTAVTATEPIFGPMADALGLTMRNQRFQLAMMNGTEPSARDVAAIIERIKRDKITAVFLENISDERLMRRISEETGATVGGTLYSDSLTGEKGAAPTYIAMVRHNIKALSSALGR